MQGHNSGELDRLSKIAREGLDKVSKGEEYTFEGWLRYGSALNAGREMFAEDDDYNFGKWKQKNVYSNLEESFTLHPADEAAAMWAAKDLDHFNEVRESYPRVRTVRGLHAKWKQEVTDGKAGKVEKLVELQRSTDSDGEKQAIQEQLDRMSESGVDVDKIVAKIDKGDTEVQISRKMTVAKEIVELIRDDLNMITSCLVALAKDEKQLEKLKGMLL